MKKIKFNTRTCIITNKKFSKDDLLRITNLNGNLVIGNNIKNGKGYYISSVSNYSNEVIKNKIEKKLELSILQSDIDNIKQLLMKGRNTHGKS